MKRVGLLVLAGPRNGGTYQYTLSMVEAMRALPGCKVTLYTQPGNTLYDGFGMDVRPIDSSKPRWFVQVLGAAAGLKFGDPFPDEDVVIAPVLSPALLHTRAPFAFTLHDMQERHYPHYFAWWRRQWRSWVNSRLARAAATVICESSFVAEDIVRFLGIDRRRVAVIAAPPVPMTGESDDPARLAQVRDKYRLPSRYLFYPAQFWPHKNHANLVQAFARMAADFPDVDLVFTGRAQDEYERVFALVDRLGLSGRVHHTGYVDQADLFALYRLATAAVVPTLFESVSIPVYEAQQAGTPVAASDVLAIPEQVGDAGLLFDPARPDSIAEALRRLLGDDAMREELAARGRSRFAAMTMDRYRDQLRDLVARIGRGAEASTPNPSMDVQTK